MVKKVIVVGGGLAGLSSAMRLAERGCHVTVVSVTKVKRSHSVCAQGGINAALCVKEKEDSPLIHAYDTIKGGDFLANQPPVVEMCLAAPRIIEMFDRLGCPFNRSTSGHLDVRRFGGTLYHRTVFCGASTGQQLLYTLDEQVRRFEVAGSVKKMENHEFLRLVLDDKGQTRGIVLLNLFNQKLELLKADAVVFATGGPGLIFRQSTNSTFCTGAANGRLFCQGMHYANGEFIQIHPSAIPGYDKLRLISESVRGEGGRVWVLGDSSKSLTVEGREIPCGESGKPWYFLEEMYPGYGNLVGRDVGARALLQICEMGLGVDGKNQVYLDVTELSSETRHKLAAVLDIYEKFTGEDPNQVPMKIFPAVHYSMGGAWVDYPASDDSDRDTRFRQMTNLAGCFQCGESDYQYHGANRLGANALLSCIYSGLLAGDEVVRYVDTLDRGSVSENIFKRAMDIESEFKRDLLKRSGKENVHQLHVELSDAMVWHMTVKRSNQKLEEVITKIHELKERYKNISLDDKGAFTNQTFQFAHQFHSMLELALVMTTGALLRDESRGSHFKEGFERDDTKWLKTTVASYSPDGPKINYEPVDTRHVDPVVRDYSVAEKKVPKLRNLPKKFDLPI